MLIPIGEPVRLPVQIVFATAEPPFTLAAVVVEFDGEVLHVELPREVPEARPGARVVVDGTGGAWHVAVVRDVEGRRLRLERRHTHVVDDRAAPRTQGLLGLRWRKSVGRDAIARWVDDGVAWPALAWQRAMPDVDFSLAGLRFVSEEGGADLGDELLLAIVVPGAETVWRCAGVVRRVQPGPGDTAAIAVEFVRLPEGAEDALVDYALDLAGVPRPPW